MKAGTILTAFVLAGISCFGPLELPGQSEAEAEVAVTLLSDPAPGLGASHGLGKVTAALVAKAVAAERADAAADAKGKILIVAGLATGSGAAARLAAADGVSVPRVGEALAIRHTRLGDKPALLVTGSDDRGLMYALLDVADRIGWAADASSPLSEVDNAAERPFVSERSLSIYTMHRRTFESFFYDEDYWAEYLDMLARNRFNTFALLLGYENWGYFTPPYPYFFDVEGYPDVRVVGQSKEKQQKNLKALNRLIEMTHQRGLNFTLGIWDHIYRGGVQGPTDLSRQPTEGIVWGLTSENLVPYTKTALRKFFQQVPELDAVQFRMHGESGLRRSEMEEFWTDVYRIVKQSGGDVRFDARAKNFPHSLIDRALELDVNIRMCTKYWMEQMGLPFHPTHVHPRNQHDRRHGYADMLRYPKQYDMHWRIWSGGTTRVFLWGDPEYVRRIAASTHVYGDGGYEITAPMATKMQDHPHELEPFELLNPKYQYYDWEFQRYWHFFQVYGRMGYNPHTPPEVWQREFQRRFGHEAAPFVEQGLHRASQILPRAVAYSYPYHHFPTTRGWVERQRQDDLPGYAKALPSDTQQFLSIDEAARNRLQGTPSAKIHPLESAAWFARASRDVLQLAGQAEACIGRRRNKEFDSTIVDLKMLAHLAAYHSHRARAGVAWASFKHSSDLHALDGAIAHESRAVEAWQKMVEAAGDVYHHDLMMGRRGSDLSGHWKDELVKLKHGLDELRGQRSRFRPEAQGQQPHIAHLPLRRALPGKGLGVRATISGQEPIARVRLAYGGGGGAFEYVTMKRVEPFCYRAVIPADKVKEGLRYFIEATDGKGQTGSFPAQAAADPIAVAVTDDNQPPSVIHESIASAPAEKPLAVTATVRDPSGVKWVRLRYRSMNQHLDFQTLEMLPAGEKDQYRAVVPAEQVVSKWDFMYLVEVMDNHGNGKIHPDLEKEMPYVVVKLQR